MKFCWPKTIRLPGFVIHVAFTDDRGLQGRHGDWDYNMKKGEGTIRIHSGGSKVQQRLTFAHELQHAIVDYLHFVSPDVVDDGKQ